jgi:hypothetical protein
MTPLSGLRNLRHLDIHHNEISNISVLSGLGHLVHLDLHENPISDISVLAGLAGLRKLRLMETQISDISDLLGLTSLELLDLRRNLLSEETCNVQIPFMRTSNPGLTLLHDCDPLGLSLSSTIGGSVIDPGEGEFLYAYATTEFVIVEAKADPCFVFAGWSGSYSSMRNPAFVPMNQDHQIRANFASDLRVICVDDDGSGDPSPGDPNLSDPQENGTAAHPFDRIQEAIEMAAEGASVIVRPGTYRENISFLGKRIALLGIDPDDPNGTASPVLDGAGTGPAVQFTRDEDPNCVLSGFIITRGSGPNAGAILCSNASPTITNCLIVGNRATDPGGAAVYCTNSKAVLVNCTIADNHGGAQGAGIALIDSEVTLIDSIVWGNTPQQVFSQGGVVPWIRYSDIAGGWLGLLTIIDADPLFARRGYWANPSDPDVAADPEDPGAVWIDGDYHLRSQAGRWDPNASVWVQDEGTSPCIDAGSPASPVADEPLPNGGRVNMGAYGGTAQASQSFLGSDTP